ncbi:MAG: hypothetical protein E7621_01475 [Ruminococcaceae bacterium]|nr:hypothetical protein [Oscillospiraceae bacterium]
MKRKFFFIPLILMLFAIMTSCASKDGKNELCDFLLTDGYSAAFDFCITENGTEKLSGSAVAAKEDIISISFSAPDVLNGLSVSSDADALSDTLTFSYYGMKAPLPSGALSDINTMMSFFSDECAVSISSLPRNAVKTPEDETFYSEASGIIKELSFTNGEGVETRAIYDAATGLPLNFTAKKPDREITITFTKIKRPTLKDGTK